MPQFGLQQEVAQSGLAEDWQWLTEHRKVTSAHPADFSYFLERIAEFDRKSNEAHMAGQKAPSITNLVDYWGSLDATDRFYKTLNEIS